MLGLVKCPCLLLQRSHTIMVEAAGTELVVELGRKIPDPRHPRQVCLERHRAAQKRRHTAEQVIIARRSGQGARIVEKGA